MMSFRRDLAPLAFMAVVGVLAALLVTIGGVDSVVLQFAPALVLALPLLAGRYVGEDRLAAVVAAFVPRRRRAAVRLVAAASRAPRAIARGGRLVAAALAQRGPPVVMHAG